MLVELEKKVTVTFFNATERRQRKWVGEWKCSVVEKKTLRGFYMQLPPTHKMNCNIVKIDKKKIISANSGKKFGTLLTIVKWKESAATLKDNQQKLNLLTNLRLFTPFQTCFHHSLRGRLSKVAEPLANCLWVHVVYRVAWFTDKGGYPKVQWPFYLDRNYIFCYPCAILMSPLLLKILGA